MNLKVVEINSNERFTIYRCEDGQIVMMGRDFQNNN